MSIGTIEHATAVVEHHAALSERHSDEFRYLGSGCYRSAYLHIATNVVYKVGDEHYMQEQEVEAAQGLRKFIWQAVYVPKTELFKVTRFDWVVAMEFIEAPLAVESGGSYESACHEEWRRKGGSNDMHRKNWLHLNGIMIPIDMGCDF